MKRVAIPHTRPYNLFWSHDSKKLAFTASLDDKRGTYTISIPEDLKPKRLTEKTGSQARWLKEGNQILWLSNGKPAAVSSKGEETAYAFNARQVVDPEALWRAAFDHVVSAQSRHHCAPGRGPRLSTEPSGVCNLEQAHYRAL